MTMKSARASDNTGGRSRIVKATKREKERERGSEREEAHRVVYSDGIDSESGGLDTFLYR